MGPERAYGANRQASMNIRVSVPAAIKIEK
jgi:hypothetical protein